MYFVEKFYENKYWDGSNLPTDFDPENSLFFDIETTGLSPLTSFVFLIGLAFIKNNNIILRQYFAINQNEERDILNYFIEDLPHFNYIYHFNGCSFDIPFVNKRLSTNDINYQIDKDASIDIYKILKNNKEYFNFKSFKLQNIEKEFGIIREDDMSGKEVAEGYAEFLKTLSSLMRDKILLHNEEDIINLFQILPLLTINNNVSSSTVTDCSISMTNDNLAINGSINISSSEDIEINHNNIIFAWKRVDNSFSLSFPIQEGNLYFTFKDYNNYYYISEIDQAVHKSIAKYYKYDNKQHASPDNCHTKFFGQFIQFPMSTDCNTIKVCSVNPGDKPDCITLEELKKNINNGELLQIINLIVQKLRSRD